MFHIFELKGLFTKILANQFYRICKKCLKKKLQQKIDVSTLEYNTYSKYKFLILNELNLGVGK